MAFDVDNGIDKGHETANKYEESLLDWRPERGEGGPPRWRGCTRSYYRIEVARVKNQPSKAHHPATAILPRSGHRNF